MFGVPGTGKTTYATAEAERISRFAYVLAHSGGTLPDVYPDGRKPKIKEYENVKSALLGISRDPSGINLIHSSASDVIDLGVRIAAASLENNGGDRGVPVLLFVDEVVAADEMNAYRLHPTMKQLVALRRHKNVGVLFTSQHPNLCHYQMIALATEVTFFRVIHEDAIRKFRKIGVPRHIVERIPTLSLKQHERITWRDGEDG